MKSQKKGFVAFLFLGGIMVTSGVLIGVPGMQPHEMPEVEAVDPSEKYPIEERARYCGTDEASSTPWVREFEIPTPCTNPVGITTDAAGNVWFAETNTGSMGMFMPSNGTFREFPNPSWPPAERTMTWGAEYAPDGSIWYTDDRFNSIWRFSTIDERYTRFNLAGPGEDLLPQRIDLVGSQIIANDFTGNNLILFDPAQDSRDITYVAIPPPTTPAVTAEFTIDDRGDLWFTNWQGTGPGLLVRFDLGAYYEEVALGAESVDTPGLTSSFRLPPDMLTPNGIAYAGGLLWLADTSSSYFASFDPVTERFVIYETPPPRPNSYGNHTGLTFDPISRPYWIETDGMGRLVFNEQTGNSIAVFDPASESLAEYHIPSNNPFWADCDPGVGLPIDDCGLAQVFDFAIHGDMVWFTEWVENKIGVVDTSVRLPFDILPDETDIVVSPGGSYGTGYSVLPGHADAMPVYSSSDPGITVLLQYGSDPSRVGAAVNVMEGTATGQYKVALGAQHPDITVSRYITVTVQ